MITGIRAEILLLKPRKGRGSKNVRKMMDTMKEKYSSHCPEGAAGRAFPFFKIGNW